MNLVEWDEVEEINKKSGSACPIVKLMHSRCSRCINTLYGGAKPPYESNTDRHKNAHRKIWQVLHLLYINKFDEANILQYLYAKFILRTNF